MEEDANGVLIWKPGVDSEQRQNKRMGSSIQVYHSPFNHNIIIYFRDASF